MYNTFLSIITVVQHHEDVEQVGHLLGKLYPVLKENFSDFEFIIVNNLHGRDISKKITPLEEALKHHVFQLNLSTVVNRNHAILSGLDRSNGDYTLIFEFDFNQA